MFENLECVFLLPLRDAAVSSAKNLQEFLQLFHMSEKICMAAIEELKETEGENVLIIADGWDELDARNRSEDSFLYKLLITADILPLVSVLITSRPSASRSLHLYRFRFIEVMGFDEDDIQQYIESEFEEHPEIARTLTEQLKSNTLLQSVCSVPLNCALICHIWHTLNQVLPTTLTKLYSLLILCFLLRNLKKRFPEFSTVISIDTFDCIREDLQEKFWQTCKFAYDCLLMDGIVFTQQEIAKHFPEVSIQDASDDILCFGLLQSAESLLPNGQGLSFHFAHLTIQEFLAALHVATQSPTYKLVICNTYAKSDRFSMVWRFVFGLCSNEQCYSKFINSVDDKFLDRFLLLVKDEELLLCHCAAELNNKMFNLKVASRMGGDLSVSDNLLDCTAVFHILRHTSPCSNVQLDLSGCGLGDRQLQELADILSCAGSKLKVKRLSLDNNKLTSKGVRSLFNRASASMSTLENVDMENNKIDTLSFPTSIKTLHASSNPLGVVGMQSLRRCAKAKMLVKLKSLTLSDTFANDISQIRNHLTLFLSSIAEHCPHLQSLDLSKNTLDEHAALALGKALPILCKNRKHFDLDISETNLNSKAAVAFSNGVAYTLMSSIQQKPSLTDVSKCDLTLCDNPIGHEGLLAVLRMLGAENCSITDLDLNNTKFHSTEHDILAARNLAPTIEATITYSTLTTLNLNNSRPTEGTYVKMLEIAVKEGALCSLETLYLSKALTNNPTENGLLLTTLLPSIAYHCSNLKSLDLSNNRIGVSAANILGETFVYFTSNTEDFELDLSATELNTEAVTGFCSCVMSAPRREPHTRTQCGTIEINFSNNPVGNHGLSALFQVLKTKNCLITTLHLDNVLDDGSVGVDFTSADTYGISKLTTLYLNGNNNFVDGLHMDCLEKAAREGALANLQELNLSDTLSNDATFNGVLLSKLLPSISLGCLQLVELDLSNNMLNSSLRT